MNKIALIAFALFITGTFLSAAPYSYVERKGFHISIAAGGAIPADADFDGKGTVSAVPFVTKGEIDLETGPAVMLTAGYTWDAWRFELEYAYHSFDVDDVTLVTTPADILPTSDDGSVSMHTIMANISYDWFFYQKWYWYNGVGIGVAIVRAEAVVGETDSDAAFAFQAMTGLGYQVMENLDIFWGYRFLRITDTEFTGTGAGITNTIEVDGLWINQIEAGLRVRF